MPKESAKSNSKNSSKTARVLGLLTNSSEEEQVILPPPEPEHEAPRPPQPSDDQVVEADVRSALEHELEGVLVEMQEQDSPEVFTPLQEGPAAPPEFIEAPVTAGAVPPEPDSAPEAAGDGDEVELAEARGPKSRLEPEIFCFNITQALVEAKADKYIDLFGLCKCDRCRIDVIALSLTNLPAKYVVAHKNEMVPLLSVYEGKYNAAIVSQVMNACKLVMEHPRHNK